MLSDRPKKGDIVIGESFAHPVDIGSGGVVFADRGPMGAIGASFE